MEVFNIRKKDVLDANEITRNLREMSSKNEEEVIKELDSSI